MRSSAGGPGSRLLVIIELTLRACAHDVRRGDAVHPRGDLQGAVAEALSDVKVRVEGESGSDVGVLIMTCGGSLMDPRVSCFPVCPPFTGTGAIKPGELHQLGERQVEVGVGRGLE